ncbi:MAG: VWA domain-containing protein [Chloroflexota bacterium]|nr:VWA domain-containing protein [Chloroflexota bacterium]
MTFAQPLFLFLLIALPYFAHLGRPTGRYGRGRVWTALALRGLIALLIVLSLAGVQSVHGGDELAVVFLVDVSDSVLEPERERALAFVEQSLATMGPDDRAALVIFGADALVERPMMSGGELGDIASIPRTHQTDLEGAIRAGMALFPSGAARRLVILSDGCPTLGEDEQAVRLARAQGVQVDVVPLASPLLAGGTEGGRVEAWLSELAAPDRLHQGEEFTLSVTARSMAGMEAMLTVLAGEKVVAREQVYLNPGPNTFAVPLAAGEPGFTPFRVYLAPAADVYPQNNALSAFTMIEGPPRVLVVAPSGEGNGGTYLQAALRSAGLDVRESSPGALGSDPASLAGYAAIVLVDTPAQSLSPRAQSALQSYVRDLGGGLVAVGGPHAYGVGGWYNTPLEQTLPVEMTLHDPERFPPMSIVVVIDKSGSMTAQEGGVQKIRLAGEAAARVAELITDLDDITIIAFDDRPVDVIGPLPGSQREEVVAQVTRLQAGGGGIYVRESLQEALGYLADSAKAVRHIILLADGSDAEHQQGVRELVEEQIAGQNITLSAVAIGAGQDLRFLEEIATLGGGRYHFTDRAASLPVIFAEETQLAKRSYVVEEPFYPRQTSPSPILTGIETVPQLAGYVATTPKPAARMILSTHQDDPLLAVWQYGLGRALAWTSDATGRWAQRWVGWDGFPRFWAQAVRWTVVERADVPVEVTVTLEGEEARVTVDAVDESGGFVNGLDVSLSLVGPEGEPARVELAQAAPGRYEGTFLPQAEGAYLMRLTGALAGEEAVALTTGWVMGYSPEYASLVGDPAYMARLAELGGGAVLEEPSEAFAHDLVGAGVRRDLWPYLLGLAAFLLPFDVGVRRLALGRRDLERGWAWVTGRVLRRRPRSVVEVEAPSPVGRLFQAKSRAEERRPAAGAPMEVTPPPVGQPPTPAPSSRPIAPPSMTPSPVSRGRAGEGAAAEGETLAGRLLKKKREREEDEL